jgi:hypothetical protein
MAITTMEPLVPIADGDETPVEAEGDGDEKTYCYCDTVSYGEMIACDDSGCEREWVRFFSFFCILSEHANGVAGSSISSALD